MDVGRAGLLADIRKGKSLKKTASAKERTVKEKVAPPPSGGGDIMSALALALDRRRQGMGGKTDPKPSSSSKKSKKSKKGKKSKNSEWN